MVGTMIEIPRAAADRRQDRRRTPSSSRFGTNDLTQMTFGYSRDDAGKFLPEYVEKDILPDDPFQVLDQEGVGQLIQIGVEHGRRHPPEPQGRHLRRARRRAQSVEFCHKVGLNYVCCSPYRVPIARLAAAQAAIKEMGGKVDSGTK